MSAANTNPRSGESQSGALSRLGLDKAELKSIKVAIMRRNVSEPNSSAPLLRSLEDPAQLVIHNRPDEGVRPLFDREDVVVNKESQEERMILSSSVATSHKAASRSSSRSSQSSVPLKPEKRRASPEAHTSRYRRSSSHSRKAVYKTSPPRTGYSSRRSRTPYRSPERSRRRERSSPGRSGRDRTPPRYYKKKVASRSPGHKGGPSERRRSRSPPPKVAEKGRSPQKYKGPPERRRTRSPPPRRNSRGRSRSYSPPHHRSRYSRSPRHDRRYDRRSRSPPRRRYTPERHSRRSSRPEVIYEPPRIPNPYFEGAEFWVPNPMLQPRFIPRQMIPPGAFPYPFRPGMPPMGPPRMPFRPRIVYNTPAAARPRSTPSISVAAIESSSTVTTTVTREEEPPQNVTITECSTQPENSEKNDDE